MALRPPIETKRNIMSSPLIACGQVTWHNNDEEAAFADIAAAGYAGVPPKVPAGVTAADIVARLDRHGLKAAPPYYAASFWDPEQEQAILQRAEELGRLVQEIGCTELYVAAGGGGFQAPSGAARSAAAGHVTAADMMSDAEFEQFARTLTAFGRITLKYGVRICFHNHVGTVIETRAELDRLMELCDDDAVFLGIDTGHLAWAGMDVVEVCRVYRDRILTMHLKDIVESVRATGAREGWDYDTFTRNGVFAELGEGSVDFIGLNELLDEAGFDGWLVVETDVTSLPTPLDSARTSREYLRSTFGW
jgi:inosose dehydratase